MLLWTTNLQEAVMLLKLIEIQKIFKQLIDHKSIPSEARHT